MARPFPLAEAQTVLALRLRTAMERWGAKTATWLGFATGTALATLALDTCVRMALVMTVCARLMVWEAMLTD